jgi:hypothetical protein
LYGRFQKSEKNEMSKATDSLEALLNEPGEHLTKRMNFTEKCAMYYILKKSISYREAGPVYRFARLKQNVIASVFGVAPNVVSNLARAMETDARSQRAIAEEYERLGDAAFGEKYYTDAIADMIVQARAKAKFSGRRHYPGLYAFTPIEGPPRFVDVRQASDKTWSYAIVDGAHGDSLTFAERYGQEPTHTAALDYAHEDMGRPALAKPPEKTTVETALEALR